MPTRNRMEKTLLPKAAAAKGTLPTWPIITLSVTPINI